ncbi:Zn-binding domain-containing protein, partial [Enterococcus faecium]|uniref:Zn-binding domain-containing protein n=2 Tax=Bacteria TaxID=2 RepID=UPI003565630A
MIASERSYERDYTISARLLLVHSFAHALIRTISVDCGYSSSSLRERLYVSEADGALNPMNGVLIYTGSPDSEGSLGGLVRLADPVQLTRVIMKTIRSSLWCGSDPV